jgi:hypothetical protein
MNKTIIIALLIQLSFSAHAQHQSDHSEVPEGHYLNPILPEITPTQAYYATAAITISFTHPSNIIRGC